MELSLPWHLQLSYKPNSATLTKQNTFCVSHRKLCIILPFIGPLTLHSRLICMIGLGEILTPHAILYFILGWDQQGLDSYLWHPPQPGVGCVFSHSFNKDLYTCEVNVLTLTLQKNMSCGLFILFIYISLVTVQATLISLKGLRIGFNSVRVNMFA